MKCNIEGCGCGNMELGPVETAELGGAGMAHVCQAGTVYADLWGKARHFQTVEDFLNFINTIVREAEDEAEELGLDGGEPLSFGL